jgi:hypothetical protein
MPVPVAGSLPRIGIRDSEYRTAINMDGISLVCFKVPNSFSPEEVLARIPWENSER